MRYARDQIKARNATRWWSGGGEALTAEIEAWRRGLLSDGLDLKSAWNDHTWAGRRVVGAWGRYRKSAMASR
jgi:hypothetical protein